MTRELKKYGQLFECLFCKEQGKEYICGNVVPHISKTHANIGGCKEYKRRFPGIKMRPAPNSNFGNKEFGPSAVAKSVAVRTGQPLSEEHRANIGLGNKNSERHKESRRRIRERADIKRAKEEVERISNLLKGEEDTDYIVCQICGKPYEELSTYGHLRMHNITYQQYKKIYPNAVRLPNKIRIIRNKAVSKARLARKKRLGYLNSPVTCDKIRQKTNESYLRGDHDDKSLTNIELMVGCWLNEADIKHVSQYPFLNKHGKIIFINDFAIPERKIIIECHGDYYHARPEIWEKPELLNEKQKHNLRNDKKKLKVVPGFGWKYIPLYGKEIKGTQAIDVLKKHNILPNDYEPTKEYHKWKKDALLKEYVAH